MDLEQVQSEYVQQQVQSSSIQNGPAQQSGDSHKKQQEANVISVGESETIQNSKTIESNANVSLQNRPENEQNKQIETDESFRNRFDSEMTAKVPYVDPGHGYQIEEDRKQSELGHFVEGEEPTGDLDESNQHIKDLTLAKRKSLPSANKRIGSIQIENTTMRLTNKIQRLSGGTKTYSGQSQQTGSSNFVQTGSGQSGHIQNDSGQSGCQSSQECNDQGNISQDQIIGTLETDHNRQDTMKVQLNESQISERFEEENEQPEEEEEYNEQQNEQEIEQPKEVEDSFENIRRSEALEVDPVDPIAAIRARKTVDCNDFQREVTFNNCDLRVVPSASQAPSINDNQTYGRQPSQITNEDFDNYDVAIIKSNSMHKKRKKRANDLENSDNSKGGFGCCAGFYTRNRKVKESKIEKPIESPMLSQFKRVQEQKLEKDEKRTEDQQIEEKQEQSQIEPSKPAQEQNELTEKPQNTHVPIKLRGQEQLKKLREARKYSLKEQEQKQLLELSLGKIRQSIPSKFKPNINTKSPKQTNKFNMNYANPFQLQEEEVCADPMLASPLFGTSMEQSFCRILDESLPTFQNDDSFPNIAYPFGDNEIKGRQDAPKNVSFQVRRQDTPQSQNYEDETPTELKRMMREELDQEEQEDETEEQGLRKDSMDQLESMVDNRIIQPIKLFKVQEDNSQAEKRDLADVIRESSLQDVVVSQDGSQENVSQNFLQIKSAEAIQKRAVGQRRISDFNMVKSKSALGQRELQAATISSLTLRKQSTNKVVSLFNNPISNVNRFDLDQQSNEEVDNMIKRNDDKNLKPVSDDASSFAGTSSKSDPFQFHKFGNRQSYVESSNDRLSSMNKDFSPTDNNIMISKQKSKTPPVHKKNNKSCDPFSSEDQSFELNLNKEIVIDGESKDATDKKKFRKSTINSSMNNLQSLGMFQSIVGNQDDKNSRGKKSDGKLKAQSGLGRNSKMNQHTNSQDRIPIYQQVPNSAVIEYDEQNRNTRAHTPPQGSQPVQQQKQPVQVKIDDFNIVRKLGQGAYGKVYLATYNDQEYSIKKLSKDFLIKRAKVPNVFRERDILINGRQFPFLPDLHHTFDDDENVHIVMEYIPNGTLEQFIKKHVNLGFRKEMVQFYAAQIVLILEYLQKQNVAHRDIKPENIMLGANNYIKLIDFGEAKIVDTYDTNSNDPSEGDTQVRGSMNRRTSVRSDATSAFFRRVTKKEQNKKKSKMGTFVGTSLYQAPEMVAKSQSGLYTDLWALGCIIFELTFGKKMFGGKNASQVMEKVLDRDFQFPATCKDETVMDLIDELTEMNPQNRIGLKDIDAIKNHKYFEGVDFESIRNQTLMRPQLPIITATTAPVSDSPMLPIPTFADMDTGPNNADDIKDLPPFILVEKQNPQTQAISKIESAQNTQKTGQVNTQIQNGPQSKVNTISRINEESKQVDTDESRADNDDQTNRIHIVQDEQKSKVLKMSLVKRKQGILVKSYKEYEMYLLQNGLILFYDVDEKSKRYLQEKKSLRLQIDETMFIEEYGAPKQSKKSKEKSKSQVRAVKSEMDRQKSLLSTENVERFSIRLGNTQTHLEVLKADNWPSAFKNFTF